MKTVAVLLSFAVSLNGLPGHTNNDTLSREKGINILNHVGDTCIPKLEQFKQFARKFFSSVEVNDTIFLKRHIVFPIPASSFSNFDRGVLGLKTIDSKTFFRRLRKLIPESLTKRINKEAEYDVSQNEYSVTLYSETDGVESNCSWIFQEREGEFYLELFTSEAG